jgi:hypothetical protein
MGFPSLEPNGLKGLVYSLDHHIGRGCHARPQHHGGIVHTERENFLTKGLYYFTDSINFNHTEKKGIGKNE